MKKLKNWDNQTWLSSKNYINQFNEFLNKRVRFNKNMNMFDDKKKGLEKKIDLDTQKKFKAAANASKSILTKRHIFMLPIWSGTLFEYFFNSGPVALEDLV